VPQNTERQNKLIWDAAVTGMIVDFKGTERAEEASNEWKNDGEIIEPPPKKRLGSFGFWVSATMRLASRIHLRHLFVPQKV